MLSLVTPEKRVPPDHPLRQIKSLAEEALRTLSPVFDEMYSSLGRPSIPPERLLKATLLMALYTVRSERMLCEQIEYNLLFRWFLDMNMDEETFDPTTFTKNRQRLLEHDVARERELADELGRGADEPRALHRRRHVDRSVGVVEELPAEGREARRSTAA